MLREGRESVMMKRTAVLTLLLLFWCCLQDAETAETSKQSDPSTELKQLRDIVYAQGTVLVELRTEMKYVEKENAALKTKMAKQIKQNKETGTKVELLTKESSAQAAEVSAVKSSLTASKSEVKRLKKENAATKTALEASQSELKKLMKENAAFKSRLETSEHDLENLKTDFKSAVTSKVVFSACLTATVGPASGEVNVVYTNVITNIGGAYNPSTGFFTAPVKGVYYFTFTFCSGKYNYYSGLNLYKNSVGLLYPYEYNENGYVRYITGSITLQLEVGDVVHTRVPHNYVLHEFSKNRNIFSGFIISAI